MPKPILRCSQLPILAQCLGLIGCDLTIDTPSDVTEKGTDVHAYAARLIREGTMPAYDGPDSDFRFLLSRVEHMWSYLAPDMPSPHVERHLQVEGKAFVLSGHPDVYSLGTAGEVEVVDFKSGYNIEAEVRDQLLGYAVLIHMGGGPNGEPDKASRYRLRAAWLRPGEIQEWSFTWPAISEWMSDLGRRLLGWNGRDYTAGEWCQYCPRFHSCPARTALARSAVEDLLGMDMATVDRAALAPSLPGLYARVQMVERQAAAFRSWLKSEVERGGPIDTGDGKQLQLGTKNMLAIDVQKAWPIFKSVLTEEELAGCIKVGQEKLWSAVAGHSAPREIGKDKKALMLRLEAAEAVRSTKQEFLQWKKLEADEEGTSDQ